MKVNRPGVPPDGSVAPAEPLDQHDHAIKADDSSTSFSSRLTGQAADASEALRTLTSSTVPTDAAARARLAEIADATDLTNALEATAAVRKSASLIIRASLSEGQ